MAEWAVRAESVTKRYGETQALAGVSLHVAPGEIFALLGPNGAGKSTLFRILSTLLDPDDGVVEVLGHDAAHEPMAIRRRIGVLFQETVLDPHLTGAESLYYHGRLYGQDGTDIVRRTSELEPFLSLGEAMNRKVKTYSGGMKRRLEVARTLMTSPELLLLDEPTTGLDPQNREAMWEFIRRRNREAGTTVIFCTHYMEEAEALADRVAVIDHGRILAEGTPADLTARLEGDVLHVRGQGAVEPFASAMRSRADLFRWVEAAPGGLRAGVANRGGALVAAVSLAAESRFTIEDLSVRRPNLNEVFLTLTGRSLRD